MKIHYTHLMASFPGQQNGGMRKLLKQHGKIRKSMEIGKKKN